MQANLYRIADNRYPLKRSERLTNWPVLIRKPLVALPLWMCPQIVMSWQIKTFQKRSWLNIFYYLGC